jgi:DNA-binding MarR family transcriptional regulator
MAGGESSAARERANCEFERAWRALSAAQRRLRGRDAKQAGELSAPQYNLLRPLLDDEPLSSGELSSRAGLTAATATHMLEQLVAAGVVRRERSTADRRVVMTTMTETGRDLLVAKHAVLTASWNVVVADLDQAAIEQAIDVLRLMTNYVDQI